MSSKDSDLKKIEELIEIMKQNDLVEIEIKHDDDKIVLKRSVPQAVGPQHIAVPIINHSGPVAANTTQAAASTEATSGGVQKDEGLVEIKSPLVGTFYATPSPDSDHFVEVGSQVEPQTVVCIIEAMKLMNEIKAEVKGKIVDVLVENGDPVEFGQVLFLVEPA